MFAAVWTSLVPEKTFLRIHRGTIVSQRHVRDVERRIDKHWRLWLRGSGERWSISRAYRQAVRSRLGI